jgi:hypothetical protein
MGVGCLFICCKDSTFPEYADGMTQKSCRQVRPSRVPSGSRPFTASRAAVYRLVDARLPPRRPWGACRGNASLISRTRKKIEKNCIFFAKKHCQFKKSSYLCNVVAKPVRKGARLSVHTDAFCPCTPRLKEVNQGSEL